MNILFIYRELCEELHNKSYSDCITVINDERYIGIFNKVPSNTYYLLQIYQLHDNAIFLYIATTRKISFHPIIEYIILHLNTLINIKLFFSFYSHDEIEEFIRYTNKEVSLYNDKFILYSTVFICHRYENKDLFDFLMEYAGLYNISVIVMQQANFIYYATYKDLFYYNTLLDYNIIPNHEKAVLFSRSLRNCWIMSCIV